MDEKIFELYQQLTPDMQQLVDDTISFMLEHPDTVDAYFNELYAGKFSIERARELLQTFSSAQC